VGTSYPIAGTSGRRRKVPPVQARIEDAGRERLFAELGRVIPDLVDDTRFARGRAILAEFVKAV